MASDESATGSSALEPLASDSVQISAPTPVSGAGESLAADKSGSEDTSSITQAEAPWTKVVNSKGSKPPSHGFSQGFGRQYPSGEGLASILRGPSGPHTSKAMTGGLGRGGGGKGLASTVASASARGSFRTTSPGVAQGAGIAQVGSSAAKGTQSSGSSSSAQATASPLESMTRTDVTDAPASADQESGEAVDGDGGAKAGVKEQGKPAWGRKAPVVAKPVATPVMGGAVSWPALHEAHLKQAEESREEKTAGVVCTPVTLVK